MQPIRSFLDANHQLNHYVSLSLYVANHKICKIIKMIFIIYAHFIKIEFLKSDSKAYFRMSLGRYFQIMDRKC